ncbi:MAG TPA: hypothetical protein VHX59_23890 [Mycobacteriales bacterium]|nr:hypothetical protein [Mycobacteriales bacterium]
MQNLLRKAAVIVAGAGAAGALAFAGNASAATPVHESVSHSVVQPAALQQPARQWRFIDSYFWGADCNAAGNRGMDNGNWSAYECRDGSAFSDYNLWVWY